MRWLVLLWLGGCETAVCTQEVGISLQVDPTVTADLDPIAPGVQTTIAALTSFTEGDVVTLDVSGQPSVSKPVDVAGVASFGLVTVPVPEATVTARATSVCGAATATAHLDVIAGSACSVAFVTPGIDAPRYAPLPTYNRATDLDPVASGEQVELAITARPGAGVELRQRSQFGEASVGVFTQVATTDTRAIVLREGSVSLYVICRVSTQTLTSPAITAFVDSVAPVCTIDVPPAGPTLYLAGRVGALDSEGEAAQLSVNGTAVPTTNVLAGASYGSLPRPSGPSSIRFSTIDHAQNACSAQLQL